MRRAHVLIVGSLFAAFVSACDGDDSGEAGSGLAAKDAGTDSQAPTVMPTAGRGGRGSAGDGASTGGADANASDVTIHFKAVVGDRDFACGQTYSGVGTSRRAATGVDFRFFVQDIALLTRDGRVVPFQITARAPHQLEDVALIDFTDDQGLCHGSPSSKNAVVTGRAPAGDYDGIVFSNGVPEALNHANIALAKAPLQDASLYWGWLNGYRFLLAEVAPADATADDDAGTADPDSDDAGVAAIDSTVIHVGSGGCAGSNTKGYECKRPNRNRVRLTGFDPTKSAVVADLAGVFQPVDLAAGLQCHGAAPGCEALFKGIGLDFGTGKALSTQGVFRAGTK